jgi:hypothetical protein
MSNDFLIDRLTVGLKPVRPRKPVIDGMIIGGICLLELILFLGMGATRPNMPLAMVQPSFWWKLTGLGLIALFSGAAAVMSFDPVRSPRRGLIAVVALVAICLGAGWMIDAGRGGWGAVVGRLDWRNGIWCVHDMTLLAIPPVMGLGVLMQRGAPTDRKGTAWMVGIAAAAWGAFVFVFSCPFDDPLYTAVWYSVGCGIVTIVSRLALPILTRW